MSKRERLTEDRVKKLKAPDPSGCPTIHRDSVVRFLGVLCSGKTTTKTYVVSYGARFQRRTIGDVTDISLDDARETALQWQKLMKKGIDPSKEAKQQESTTTASITLRQLLDRRISDEKKPLRDTSIKCYRNVFNKHLPDWLDKPISSITADTVNDRHRVIFKSVKKVEGQDGKTIADLVMRILKGLLNYAKGLKGSDRIDGLPETNPVEGLEWYLPRPRVRTSHIADADLPKFWKCISTAKPDDLNPAHAVLLKLILLTGLRIGTVRQLKWQHVDLDNRVIRLPAELMKGKRPLELPIVDGLYEILLTWRERGVERSGYVFPSSRRGKHVVDLSPAFAFVLEQTGIKITAHGLRRTLARNGKRAGVNKWIVRDILAHAQTSQTDDYAGESDADDLRQPLQQITNYILRRAGANVVKLERKTTPRRKAA